MGSKGQMKMGKWIKCDGCGEGNPDRRCIGCLHYFGEGSWDTREIYKEEKWSGGGLRNLLILTRDLVSEASISGWNPRDGDWATALFANQQNLTDAIKFLAESGE